MLRPRRGRRQGLNPKLDAKRRVSVKRIAAMVMMTILLTLNVSHAKELAIMGNRSCGFWVKHRAEGGWPTLVEENWLFGFLSGLATGTDKDILQSTDAESITLWMDNYCKANPLSSISAGAQAMFAELVNRKHL